MRKEFKKALIEVMREELIRKKKITIDNLGDFKSVHIKQYQKKEPNGDIILMPPLDYILFTPEKK